jgi:hypothetical protein
VGALLLLSGTVTEDLFWSETWTSADRLLSQLTEWLRRSRAVHSIEIDDGWSDDRDVSVLVGRRAWLDVRALAEEHGSGRTLIRVSTHLRPTILGVVTAIGFIVWRSWSPAPAFVECAGGRSAAGVTLLVIALTAWRTAQAAGAR